jgi:hypothetical protein
MEHADVYRVFFWRGKSSWQGVELVHSFVRSRSALLKLTQARAANEHSHSQIRWEKTRERERERKRECQRVPFQSVGDTKMVCGFVWWRLGRWETMRMLYKWSCQSPNGFWQNEEVCKRNVPFPHYLVLTERQSLTYLKSNSQHQVVVVHFNGFFFLNWLLFAHKVYALT